MSKRSSGGGKGAKPSGGPPKAPGKPSRKALVRASNAAGVPISSKRSTDRSFEVRKIANGHIVRESYSHPTKGYTSRETYVAGKPKITITGTGGKAVRTP